jgi:uncharacterized membrane protein YdjX (TVP38/TMEM64 family)
VSKNNTQTVGNVIRFVWITLGLTGFIVLPFLLFGEQIEGMFIEGKAAQMLQSYGRYGWLVAVILLIADLVFPIPTSSVMASLGMIYGPLLGGAIATLGSLASGLTGYAICRYFGRPAAIWMNGEKGIVQSEAIFTRAGGWMVALSRWLPVFSEVVACLAGLARMPFRIFIAALFCGSVPLGFAFAGIGYLGLDYPITTLALSAMLPVLLWLIARPWLAKLNHPVD